MRVLPVGQRTIWCLASYLKRYDPSGSWLSLGWNDGLDAAAFHRGLDLAIGVPSIGRNRIRTMPREARNVIDMALKEIPLVYIA